MSDNPTTILLIDDDPNNLEILVCYLEEAGYACATATRGQEGLDLLQQHPKRYQAILLDRMMPEMSGMEFLGQVKSDPTFSMLPVIMQTAAASPQEVQEGIDAGSFYYLTKPFTENVLLSIVNSAVRDLQQCEDLQAQVDRSSDLFTCLNTAEFQIRTLEQANTLAVQLSRAFPDPHRVAPGLIELLINAIEHGNLQISYQEKTQLIESGEWETEVTRRLAKPENSVKHAILRFQRNSDSIEITIEDRGPGFDWHQYMNSGMDLACASHGRGIVMAKALSFDTFEYQGSGNMVKCTINLSPTPEHESQSCELETAANAQAI